ncbi:MAG: YtxH domain-containing protein [Acidobacteria bacterium]|nr:YtxH domain-containing protein [Acidobacteriota bacterium]
MSENRGSTAIEVTLAFLLGSVVGAGLALLFAPASGEETRRKIRETSGRLKDRVREGAEEWRGTVGEGLGKAKEGVKGFVEDKRTRSHAAVSAAKEAWQNPPKSEGEA